MKIKICGLTRAEDALLAEELGAWALGFIFWAGSSRHVDIERVRGITLRLKGRALPTGVFVDAGIEDISKAVERCGLKAVQLHGDEMLELARRVRARFPGIFLMRAFQPAKREDFDAIRPFLGTLDAVMLDSHAPDGRKGGTGQTGDWNLAATAADALNIARIVLAGGLTPANVAEAARVVKPFAVDVASGVEESAGIKSAEKLREFFRAVGGSK